MPMKLCWHIGLIKNKAFLNTLKLCTLSQRGMAKETMCDRRNGIRLWGLQEAIIAASTEMLSMPKAEPRPTCRLPSMQHPPGQVGQVREMGGGALGHPLGSLLMEAQVLPLSDTQLAGVPSPQGSVTFTNLNASHRTNSRAAAPQSLPHLCILRDAHTIGHSHSQVPTLQGEYVEAAR